MHKRLALISLIVMVSGCSTVNHQDLHQSTLTAIEQAESRIENRLYNLNLQLSNQTDYIDSLELSVDTLQQQVQQLQQQKTAEAPKQTESSTPAPVAAVATSEPSNVTVLGAIETVEIDSLATQFDARVDTGAATSSLNAGDIQFFERDGKEWVKFKLLSQNTKSSESPYIEAPVIRYAKIRQSANEKGERRAVVELWIKVGKIHEKAQFTLADRSQMSHPILLGREFIKDIALVDVSKQYIQKVN
ncbi:ATP-dependent zinc protease family protein [Vibrio hippocampi]|uniref:Retropepsin-like aspartic endopeptidase domain-containing protein n=1 Tax=Vibrio hippocampi TaxID=654686 RepID=A0ABN8DJK7_9VIBR|nr:ATP-dependent zinc protease [Vibrio hippocampi]CAH0526343.1 hypothetical protein VHP8226_01753 [Vibrio hippocampi]